MSIVRKISIKGFKSILAQDIELGQLNVFIGTNGAGKSNLLEAISMVSASIEGGIDYQRLSRRGSRLSSPEIFRSSFKNKKRKNTLSINISTDEIEYSMSINAVKGFSYNAESLKDVKSNYKMCGRSNKGATVYGKSLSNPLDREKSIIPVFRSFESNINDLDIIENYAIYSPSSPILRGVSSDNSNKSPLGLYGGRLAESLAEVLSIKDKRRNLQGFFKLLEWFKLVGTDNHSKSELISEHVSLRRKIVTFKDNYMKTNFNDLYAYDVSEGALFILFTIVLLSHDDSPDFFALDNVDSTLNPGLIRKLMLHIVDFLSQNSKKQILLTTHNPTTLDAIDLFNDQHRLFVVDRDIDNDNMGQTKIERIQPPAGMSKADWREKYFDMRLSEIWLSGAIGGLTTRF